MHVNGSASDILRASVYIYVYRNLWDVGGASVLIEGISLKASGNYFDQFWSNKISVLLWKSHKPAKSMIYGFVDPWEPVVVDFNLHQNLFWKYKKINGDMLENMLLPEVQERTPTRGAGWKRNPTAIN